MGSPSPPPLPARRRRWFAAVAVLLGLVVGLGAGEVIIRLVDPRPPVNVVRLPTLRAVGADPIWEVTTDRQHRECAEEHPERRRIVFLGSSITYGFNMPAAEAFTTALEQRLNELRPSPGFCVMSFAQPGFTSKEKLAVASVELPRYRPELVLWEGWNEFGGFVFVGGAAYELRDFVLRPDGFPGMVGVPDSLNRLLFQRSRLYEHVTLKAGETETGGREFERARDRLERLAELAESSGSRLVVFRAVPLNRPFRDPPPEPNHVMDEFARAHAVPVYSLRDLLIDEDYLAIRMDDCCHFNPRGHRVLATVFERILLELVDGGR